MPLPFAAGAIGASGAVILDYALGRPLNIWGKSIEANQAPQDRANIALGNYARTNVVPPVDALLEAYRRGLVSHDVARTLLGYQGVPVTGNVPNNQRNGNGWNSFARANDARIGYMQMLSDTWDNVSKMRRSRPDPATIMQLWRQERISVDQWRRLVAGLDWDSQLYNDVVQASYAVPGLADVQQLWRLGKISDADYGMWANRLGWTDFDARKLANTVSELPTLPELMLARFRGGLTNEQFAKYATASGWTDATALNSAILAFRPAPGPSDLVRFAIREVWDDETAREWGYDDEFPAPFQAWMQWQGMGWGQAIEDANGVQLNPVPWPKAYWRAHWQIMAPTQAYRALHLLRPDQIARYRELSPGVTPFTAQDMTRVLKVSDYPPKMRAWLQAIAFTPMRLVDIRQTYRLGVRNRQWAINRLLDRGAVREDANTTLDLWDRQNEPDLQAMLNAFRKRFTLERLAENRAAYAIGGISRDAAIANMSGLGLPQPLILQVLAFEDSRQARKQLTGFISQMRRAYLTGALSDAEVAQSLSAANIAAPAIQRYLRLWQSELGIERRSLSTSQVVAAVASGALPPAVAAVRLARLGWTQPDIALQIQQALAKLARAQASAAQKVAATQKQAARDLQAAQRQAQSAQRFAQRELRRIYPVGTLKRWYCLGIRKGPTISALLLSQGYTRDSASDLLKEWAIECQTSPRSTEPAVVESQALVRRQTPLSTIKQWYQNGVYSESQTRERLSLAGYSADNVSRYIQLWQSTIGKKSGPAPEGATQTQP